MLTIYGDKEGGFSGSYQSTQHDIAKLGHCPFCNTDNCLDIHNTHTPSYWVQCDNCGAEKHGGLPTGYAGGRIRGQARCAALHASALHLAITGWNTRGGVPMGWQ